MNQFEKHPRQATYRILDASVNRALEAFRTLEEFSRFVLNDAESTEFAKSLRHQLASAILTIKRENLLSARDTEGDVGTDIEGNTEYDRKTVADVVAAAAARLSQSLRVIEEYGKTIDSSLGKAAESIRYRAYTLAGELERAAQKLIEPDVGAWRRDRLQKSVLYVLIDADPDESTFVEKIKRLSAAGVGVFQLRDKSASDRVRYERASVGARVTRECETLIVVNDRPDIAIAADADGVHVGQDDLPATRVRELIGDERLIGVSTHCLDDVRAAIRDEADYLGCGPVFKSKTKSFDELAGVEFLKSVHEETKATPIPAFAIGGIDENNVIDVLGSGFHRIAVSNCLNDRESDVDAVRKLSEALTAN